MSHLLFLYNVDQEARRRGCEVWISGREWGDKSLLKSPMISTKNRNYREIINKRKSFAEPMPGDERLQFKKMRRNCPVFLLNWLKYRYQKFNKVVWLASALEL